MSRLELFTWGLRDGWLKRLLCGASRHPAGPVYAGFRGEGADLRCRCCGTLLSAGAP